jgi:ribokinase
MVGLTVLGAINWDISIFVENFARAGEEVVVSRVEEFSGGKGGNVAVASARILGKKRVAFVGALGEDKIAHEQVSELKREGVVTDFIEFVEGMSGRAYIIVDAKGKKEIHTFFGANSRLSVEHIKKQKIKDSLTKSDIIVIMDVPGKVALAVSDLARKKGIKFVYSPGIMVNRGVSFVKSVAKGSEFIVLDRLELLNLYRSENAEECIRRVGEDFDSVVVTLGGEGCSLIRAGKEVTVSGYNPEVFDGRVVNTTGCGDAFLGVLSSYLALGYGVIESLKLANLAGAIKATRMETRGSPTREELESIYTKLEGLTTNQRKRQKSISSSQYPQHPSEGQPLREREG